MPAPDLKPTFGTATVSDKTWKAGDAIDAFTVPAATGGDGALTYEESGLPDGVDMSNTTRVVSGTPSAAGSGTATVTATDTDGDIATLRFSWTVAADLKPSFGTSTVSDKSWKVDTAIDAFTVPAATGGDGTLTYEESGLPGGVEMSDARVVSGTPSAAGSGTASVTATDSDGDIATLRFDWSVAADLTPTFGSATVSDKSWKVDTAIDAFTVPAATGGDGTLTYEESGLPGGVEMSDARVVSGTPSAAGSGTASVTATDSDGDIATLRFDWSVAADLTPTFGSATVSDKSWKVDTVIDAFTVPAATGGDGTLTYEESGLPGGVEMSDARVVSGTPSAAGSGTASVTATDSDGDIATLRFDWSVTAPMIPPTPGEITGDSTSSTPSYTLNWGSATGATGYTLEEQLVVEEQIVDDAWTIEYSGASTSADIIVNTDGTYAYRVKACNISGCSDWTATKTVTVSIPPPVPNPLTVSSTASSTGDYTVSWGVSAGATSYQLQEQDDGETWPTVYTGLLRTASIATDTNGVYSYRAQACKGTVCSDWTETGSVTVTIPGVPAVPSPFTVPSTSANGVYTLTWGASTGASRYALQERVNGVWSYVTLSPVTSTSEELNKSAGGTFGYRVKACNASGCSAWTAVQTVTVTLPPPPGTPMGPDTNTDGAYTITWGSATGATRYELQQSLNGGSWTVVSTTDGSTSSGFTGQASGEYHYRARSCHASGCGGWSAIKMVLVNRPPTVGFDSTYVARSGDLGSDGDTDIYLSPLATGTGNVGEFILRNDNGTFALDTSPTVTQLASAQSWAVSTQLEIVLEDVNVDGVWDAFVTGITDAPATANFKGAVDQIVVSPSTSGAAPTGLVVVDADLKNFINSVMAWYKDLTHFDTNVVTEITIIDGTTSLQGERERHLAYCRAEWVNCSEWAGRLTDHYGSTATCVIALASAGIIPITPQGHRASRARVCDSIGWAYFGAVRVGATIKSFSSVEEGAKEDVADFVHIWEAGETVYQVENLADVLEEVLGITIGGFDFTGIDRDDLDDAIEQRIFEVHQALLNIYAFLGPHNRGNLDIPANKVLVTKRRVLLPRLGLDDRWRWGIGWADRNDWHAALEYPLAETYGALSHNPTIAAYQQAGKLVKDRNNISEQNNLFAGTVTSSSLANMAAVWVALADKERNYCNNLDYGDPREAFIGANEYNSNGFVAGIIASIIATTDAPIHTFFLGNKPVPSSEFIPSVCE